MIIHNNPDSDSVGVILKYNLLSCLIKIWLLINVLNIVGMSFGVSVSFAESVNITIDADQITGKVNPLVFGSNVIGHKSPNLKRKTYTRFSNYGGGVWNPHLSQAVPEVIKLIKDAGIANARFPGGTAGAFYKWKETIGTLHQRPDHLFGLDEFLKFCEEIDAEVIYTLPYFTGTSQDAADLVEYLNAPDDGSNPGGGIDWASKRAGNGHPKPYGVRLFELGNEVDIGIPSKGISGADAVTYANDYNEFRKIMKSIDPSILLGAVTVNSVSTYGNPGWNDKVFKIAGNSIDFLIEHTYRPNYFSNDERVNANELFASTFRSLEKIDKYYKNLSEHFEKITGRKDIPVAVTEYTGRFVQDRPVPFRHSLGTALFNAGLMQIFLKPENNILAASQIQIANDYWGMIRNDSFLELEGDYVKRPNYYVFEMFAEHFGTELLDVKLNFSEELAVTNESSNLLSGVRWKVIPFSGSDIQVTKDNVEVVLKKEVDINFSHVRKSITVKPNTIYLLSGYLKAEGLKDIEGFCLEIQDRKGWGNIRFASSTGRVSGSTDWIYVEKEFTTLSDTSEILIMVRRFSGHGSVKGKIYVKDVKINEIEINYGSEDSLSVSASIGQDNKTIYLIVLNKNVYEDIRAIMQISGHTLTKTAKAWTLNGSNVWATNENDPSSVIVKSKSFKIQDEKKANYMFPAHSLTALELKVK